MSSRQYGSAVRIKIKPTQGVNKWTLGGFTLRVHRHQCCYCKVRTQTQMRPLTLLPILVLLLPSCGDQNEFSVCNTSAHAEEASAISRELSNRKVAHRVEGNTLCHRNGDAKLVAEARGSVNEYYLAVATVLRNSESEKRITEILIEDKKLYSIFPTSNGARLLVLHSLTPDEVMNNGQYLVRIQR